MSYLVLARKWRPQNFDDIVGQKPVVRTLQNALSRNRVAHAMVFSGVRGVGKTTIARIMAKALNCHNQDKAPCDDCTSCKDIIAGSAIDLHEIDGASNRGIQEIRDLKENLRFLPTSEKYKVIIIDEVHMLTTEAFNALLKTLEEPPEHVYFMFATTELHKVPITILSRCQRYELKRVPFAELVTFFALIADREGVDITPAALAIIASEADGSVRDGLSLLDQIFSFGGGTITEEDLGQVLGLVDRRIYANLARALLNSDLDNSLLLLNESYNQGMDIKRFALGLLNFFRSLIICKTCKEPSNILDISDQEMETLQEISADFSFGSLSSIFDILLKGVEGMQYASHPRMVMEMTFVKVAETGNIVPVSSLLSRLDSLIAGQPEPVASEPEVVKKKIEIVLPDEKSSDIIEEEPQVKESLQETVCDEIEKNGSDSRLDEEVPPVEEAPGEEYIEDAGKQPLEYEVQTKSRDVSRDWSEFLEHVKDRKNWMASTLDLSERVTEKDGELIIKYDELSECLYLQEPANMKLLAEFAQDFFQKELTIKVEVNGRIVGDGQSVDQPQEDRRALAKDPRVQMALEVLGGQVSRIRTGPRSR